MAHAHAHTAVQPESLAATFEAFRKEPVFAAGGINALREAAFARFLAAGFPTTKLEEWRHTNVAPLAQTEFGRAPIGEVSRAAVEPLLFAAEIPHRVVLVNGRWSAALSSLAGLPAGVSVRSLREAIAAGDAAVHATLTDAPPLTPFVDLNTALVEDGVVVTIQPGVIVSEPLHIVSITTAAPRAMVICPRILIQAGEHSQSYFVESYAGVSSVTSFTNSVTSVDVAASALVDHVKLQREQASTFHLGAMFARVGRAGVFRSHAVTLGGKISRNDIVSTLAGEGAECTLDGLYVADGDTLVDTHTTIDHAMPHCPSHELYKGILTGKARAVFNGKIVVRQDAQTTNAKQTNKALLLSDEAQINTKPQLEIFADDVKCTHGAAIGQLDEDAMFYMQARGISFADARNLLIHAFAGEVLDGVREEVVRERAMRLLEDKLSLWKA